jgi:hypothetical protein
LGRSRYRGTRRAATGGASPSTAGPAERGHSDSRQELLPFGGAGVEASFEDKREAAEAKSKKVMRRIRDRIDPDFVDHGQGHTDRVAQNLDHLRNASEEAGITQRELGREHTEEESTLQDVAAQLHDAGRGMPERGVSHAISSGDYIRQDRDLPLKPWERERAARYAELHSDRATKELFGTDDLNELAERGVLSREEAYHASEIRLADALDVGKKRAETNSQGEPMNRVAERLKRSPTPANQAKLSHWYGHHGIKQIRLRTDHDKLLISFDLDSHEVRDHGAEVAYRVKDTLRDANTTLYRHKYSIQFTSENADAARDWYNQYGYIFATESEGVTKYQGRST